MLTREKAAEIIVHSFPFDKSFLFEKDEKGNYWDSAHILLTAISKILVCYMNEAEQFTNNILNSRFQTIRNENPITVKQVVSYVLDSVELSDRNIFIDDEYWAGTAVVNCAVGALLDKDEEKVYNANKQAMKRRIKKDPECTLVYEPEVVQDAEV